MFEITQFRPDEIDEAIEAMDGLRDVIIPFLRSLNGDGMGEQDAQQCVRHLTLAKHALIAMGDFLEGKMQPNNLLTLEELRQMDGEPVWVVPLGDCEEPRYALVDVKNEWLCSLNSNYWELGVYDKGVIAYRRRPEEDMP